jgi:predicted TIM-barrel fold metal-dependent hydrolase
MTEVIDAHAHVLRSPAHGRELWSYFLGRTPAGGHPIDPPAFHTADEAERLMDETGVVHMNILMFTWSGRYWRDGAYTLPDDEPRRADAAEELRRRIVARIHDNNDWALDLAASRSRFSVFVGVDPVLMTEDELLKEVDDGRRRGALGVKIVPFDFRVAGDDRRLWPLFRWCSEERVPLLSQVSGYPGPPSRPASFAEALRSFPDLRLVFSHMGHDTEFGRGADAEVVDLAQEFAGVHTDLSLRLPEMLQGACSPDEFVSHVRRIGVDRVLYGTNYGFVDNTNVDREHRAEDGPQTTWARRTLEAFEALPFTHDERGLIASENFRRVTTA